MKKISILGSTGSIGTQTLDVVREHGDIEVTALACGGNVKLLEEQMRRFRPKLVAVWTEEKAKELRDKRIARMKEVHDEEFDKLVSDSDDRDTMDSVEASVEESILQDAETADNNSMDIQSEE